NLNWPDPVGPHAFDGFVDQARDGGGFGGAARELGDGADHLELVRNLVELATTDADQVRLDLAGDAEDWHVAAVGGRECRGRIQQAGARHDETDTGAPSYAGVAIGHVGGGLFVAWVKNPELSGGHG